jgi:hypothetical protein
MGMLTGGCFCGAVRYEASGEPFNATLCHCTDCRKVAGAPAVGWFSISPSGYRVVAGTPKRFNSSAHAERSFCSACGTGLTFLSHERPDAIDITICSLDDPDNVQPADHTHTGSRVAWWDGLPHLPGMTRSRPSD